jgi:tetratricopeptide (TPR) repeat protein
MIFSVFFDNVEVGEIMARKNLFLNSTLFIMAFALVINLFISARALSYYGFFGWEKGVAGHEIALMDAQEGERPLILYFYLYSSSWNERMNDEYLSSLEVDRFLEDIPKVHVNTDEGDSEKALAAQYNVDQFPAFLVFVPSFNSKPQRIHPFGERDLTTEEFLNKVKESIAYDYNNKAAECVEMKLYEDALNYLAISIDYYPNNAYTHYAIGTIYNMQAAEKNDMDLLKRAEENYLKALEIDPEHEASAEALSNLKKGMKK